MPNTDDRPDWLQLLTSLTDEELQRYGEIASDQRRLEWRHGWAQMLCVAGALVSAGWLLREGMTNGLTWRAATLFGLSVVLAYWPYRKWIVRRLWRRHMQAVEREAAQRVDREKHSQ